MTTCDENNTIGEIWYIGICVEPANFGRGTIRWEGYGKTKSLYELQIRIIPEKDAYSTPRLVISSDEGITISYLFVGWTEQGYFISDAHEPLGQPHMHLTICGFS